VDGVQTAGTHPAGNRPFNRRDFFLAMVMRITVITNAAEIYRMTAWTGTVSCPKAFHMIKANPSKGCDQNSDTNITFCAWASSVRPSGNPAFFEPDLPEEPEDVSDGQALHRGVNWSKLDEPPQ